MKIDRMLETIIYLMNHDNVPASFLARRFHVTVRTIQRDMVDISAAGIPVYSDAGKNGGYSILPNYKLNNSDIRKEEQQIIIKALQSLSTTYSNEKLDSLIEKYNAIAVTEGGQKIFWDFSVSKENQQVQDNNSLLEKAIDNRNYISFDYCNADGHKSHPTIEPLAIHYKWYAWYLFSYVEEKKNYRTYKVARMQNICIEHSTSTIDHGSIEERMQESEQEYYSTCIHIKVEFNKENLGLMNEYFPDCPFEDKDDSTLIMYIDVPAKERLWKALLLSFGAKVRIIEPYEYRDELIETAKKFLSNYDI